MFGRALTSVLWGVVADRYGRKPVILVGTASVLVTFIQLQISIRIFLQLSYTYFLIEILIIRFRVIFNTLFGLSLNYWMAISSRFLLGSMSTLLGPIMVLFYCL